MTKIEDKIAGSGRLAYFLQVLNEWQWCYFNGKVLVETKLGQSETHLTLLTKLLTELTK